MVYSRPEIIMRKSVYMLFIILILGIWLEPSYSQVKKGQAGFRFLENPVSAEAIGRGGLGIVTMDNANAVFWNPAGIGWLERTYDFTLNYTMGIADINHSSTSAAFKYANWGVFALDLLVMDYGEFYGTRRADTDQGFIETGTFSPTAYAVGVSYGRKMTNRFSFGVRVKYAREDLGSAWIGTAGVDVDDPALEIGEKAYALGELALDVGAVYDFLFRSIRFGAVIQNVSREIKYEDEEFPLPFAAGFSLCVDPIALVRHDNESSPLLFGFETRHPRDFREKYKFGLEYSYLDLVMIRSGYMAHYDERGFTFGLGIRRMVANAGLRMDYGFQDFGLFGGVHTLSFGVAY